MAWGCKHDGPCGWANYEWLEWWCDTCERSGPLPGHPDLKAAGRATPEETTP